MSIIYIILHGVNIEQKDVWEEASNIKDYYLSKDSAEKWLSSNSYERDNDSVYFIPDFEGQQKIAKIITLYEA